MEGNNFVFEIRGLTHGIWSVKLLHADWQQAGSATVVVNQDNALPSQLSGLKLTKRQPLKVSNMSINPKNGAVAFPDGALSFEPDLPTLANKSNQQLRRIGQFCRDNRQALDSMGVQIRVYWMPEEGDPNLTRIIGQARAEAVRDEIISSGCPEKWVSSELKMVKLSSPVVVQIQLGGQ